MYRLQGGLKTDVRTLEPLHIICRWFGILPNFEKDEKWKVWPVFLMLMFLTGYSYSLYGKILFRESLAPTAFLIDLTADFILIISSVGYILGINLIHGKKVRDMFKNFRKVDYEFQNVKDVKHPHFGFYSELIFFHFYIICYTVYNVYVWVGSLGFQVYRYFMLRDLHNYHVLLFTLILRSYAIATKYRFELLNEMLAKMKYVHESGKLMIDVTVKSPHSEWTVLKLQKIHNQITVLVDYYNEIFGFYFILLYINIVVGLLMPLNMLVVYGTNDNKIDGMGFGLELIILCLIWASLPLINGAIVFTACNKVTHEATKTQAICYTLIQDLSNGEKDKYFKESLLALAQQANGKIVRYSAADFFYCDNACIFSLLGSVTSYLIVLIQFNK